MSKVVCLVILLFFISTVCYIPYSKLAFAAILQNDSYNLQIDQIITKNHETTQFPQQTEIKPASAISVDKNDGSLAVNISQDMVTFGELSPTNPVIRSFSIETNAQKSQGVNVFGFEESQLASGATSIPDTSCDNGTCTESRAALWTSVLAYGLGYHCDDVLNTACVSFETPQSYKRFANLSHRKPWELILQSQTQSTKSQVSLKLNIPGTQEKSIYKNTLIFVAVPNY